MSLTGVPRRRFAIVGRFALYVRVSDGAPAEAAAGHLGMKSDLFGLQSEHFSDCHLIDGLKLRTRPCFRAVAVEAHGRVQRLHRTRKP